MELPGHGGMGIPATWKPEPAQRTLVILERQSDAAWFLDRFSGHARELLFVSANPGASWELERRGIPFTPVEACADAETLVSLGMGNFRRVDSLCAGIDAYLSERYPPFRDYGLSPAHAGYLFVKRLYDGLTLRTCMLQGIISRFDPQTVVTLGDRPAPSSGGVPFHPEESVFGLLLSLGGWPCHAEHLIPPGTGDPGQRPGGAILARVREAVKGMGSLPDALSLGRQGRWTDAAAVLALGIRNRVRGGPILALYGYGYSWNEILPELYNAGFRIFHILSIHRAGAGTERIALPDSLLSPHCSLLGVDFSVPVRDRLSPVLGACLGLMHDLPEETGTLLRDRKPAALLCGTKTRCPDHLMAAVARRNGIPVISWQHGAQGFNYAPIMPHVEMAGSDSHLVFGEGVRDTFREAEDRFGCRIRTAGSAELERLAAVKRTEVPRFRVLYATTNYYENDLYVSSPSLLQDNELFRSQKAILTVLGESGVKTAFKLHPAPFHYENLREWLRARRYPNITIPEQDRPIFRHEGIPHLLQRSETVVLDFPSTTLLQALAAGKTVFVLTRHLILIPEARSLLERCAYVTDDLDLFTRMIRDHLEGNPPVQHPDPADRSFLEHYGLGPQEGTAAARALEILAELTRKTV